MSDRSVLPELARSLSEQERKTLLNKIKSSISVSGNTEENIIRKTIDISERDILIENDLNKASLFVRFVLWLRHLFTGKEKKEIFMNLRIIQLKNSIQQKSPGISNFDMRTLNPKCAQAVFRIFTRVFPLIDLFQSIWNDSSVFEQAILEVIYKKLPKVKRNIEDFISFEEMEVLYSKTGTKSIIREKVLEEIEIYIKTIPDSFFKELEKGIQPIYNVKDLVLFPYKPFFSLFQFTPGKEGEKANFKTASAGLAVDYLEKLYYSVYLAIKTDVSHTIDQEFFRQLLVLQFMKENENYDRQEAEQIKNNDQQTAQMITEIVKEVQSLSKHLPLVELIKYYREDPYYQLIFYIPRLQLRDFFLSKMKIEVLPQIDEIFPRIQKSVIRKKKEELFEGVRAETLLYYRDYTSMEYSKLGLPSFAFAESISLLYMFIKIYYRKKIQQVLQILSHGILKQNRTVLNKLLVHAANVEDVEEKIKIFDNTLSNDEEDGKLFQRIRFSIATDSGHQRLYRSLLQQKDNEAKNLIEKGKEGLLEIKKIFIETASSSLESMKQKLELHYFFDNQSQTLEDILKGRAMELEKFLHLMSEITKVERKV